MRDFTFDGNWETKIKLSEFSKFSNPKFIGSNKVFDGTVFMKIDDKRNLNPGPEKVQINTINFLLNQENQKTIIKSIFKYIKDVAYPDIQSYIPKEESPHSYPNLDSTNDLFDVIGLTGININYSFRDNYAFYALSFNSSFNYENTLNLYFDKFKIIDHFEWSDFPSEKICQELGFRDLTEEEYEELMDKQKKEKSIFYLPSPKYGKLKPWQKAENKSYPFFLLVEGEYEKLKSFIESNGNLFENLKSNLLKTIDIRKMDVPLDLINFLKTTN